MSKYEKLKSYLQTHYNFHANLGQYNLGDREQLESETKWQMISDIVNYIDNLDAEDKDEDPDLFSTLGDFNYYESENYYNSATYAADSVPLHFFGCEGSDMISFDVEDDK